MNNTYGVAPTGEYSILMTDKAGTQLFVEVDAEGLKIAQEFKGHWYPFKHQRSGKLYARGYYQDPETKKIEQPLLHRLIGNPTRGENTAHVDGDTLNCVSKNLRNVAIGVDLKALLEKERLQLEAQEEANACKCNLENECAKCKEDKKLFYARQAGAVQEEPGIDVAIEVQPTRGVSLHKGKGRWEAKPFYEGKRYGLGYWAKDKLAEANAAVEEFKEVGPEEYFIRHPKGVKPNGP